MNRQIFCPDNLLAILKTAEVIPSKEVVVIKFNRDAVNRSQAVTNNTDGQKLETGEIDLPMPDVERTETIPRIKETRENSGKYYQEELYGDL